MPRSGFGPSDEVNVQLPFG